MSSCCSSTWLNITFSFRLFLAFLEKSSVQLCSSLLLAHFSKPSVDSLTDVSSLSWSGCEEWNEILITNSRTSEQTSFKEIPQEQLRQEGSSWSVSLSLDVSRPQRVLLLQSLGIKSSRRETHKTTRIIQGRQWKWKISRGEEKVGRRKMMKGILVGIDFYSWQSILLFLSLSTPWQWLKVGSDLFSRLLQTFTPPAPSPCLISISILVLKNRWANEYKREWRGRVNPLREWSWKRHDNRRRRTWDKKR